MLGPKIEHDRFAFHTGPSPELKVDYWTKGLHQL